MSKNAVQRLQKLHNELRSVISIYDAASSSSAGEIEFPPSEKPHGPDCKSHQTGGRNRPPKKPGSAPSCASSSTGSQKEADYVVDSSSRVKKFLRPELGKNFLSAETGKPFELDSPDEYRLILSPSKSLQTAKQVLESNNYHSSEDVSENQQFLVCDSVKDSEGQEIECSYDYIQNPGKTQICPRKICSNVSKFKVGDFEVNTNIRYQSRSTTTREKSTHPQKQVHRKKETPRLPGVVKSCPEPREDVLYFRTTCTRHDIPRKIPRLDRHRSPQSGKANRQSHVDRCSVRDEKALESRRGRQEKEKNVHDSNRTRCRSRPESQNHFRVSPGDGRRNRSEDGRRRRDSDDLEKLVKSQQLENTEFEATELSKIIEKNQEKLNKMEVSKNLAIDIAKQLVCKYDEIKNSKNKLIDRLQKVEKDNERLSNEIRCEKENKIKLERSVEELRHESKTSLIQQDKKRKQVLEENTYLRAKIKEIERIHEEELMEKQKETDRLRKKRFAEENTELGKLMHQKCTTGLHKWNEKQEELSQSDSNSSKTTRCAEKREIQQEEIRRLTTENSHLVSKIEELNRVLSDKQSRLESLETKMLQLEEEVKRQRHTLRQKTERLEDTNRELDSIRQNSQDLEEQVKLLRHNIENFDQVHQNMMGKTKEYENQIKMLEDQIAQQEKDNVKLRSDLENEKDSLLIKNKIIDDQQETIKQLREKSDEIKTLIKKNQSLERLVNIERDEKLELQDAVERLKWRKEELKKKIKSLEGDLLLAPSEVVRDLQKTQMVLHELENQVQLKQKEWELHLKSLMKEKEQACSVAEFATKKLMQTTNEFHKQSEAHKRLHQVLAENLAEKERYLRQVNEKMTQSQVVESILKDTETENPAEVNIQNGAEGWQTRHFANMARYLKYKEAPTKFSIEF